MTTIKVSFDELKSSKGKTKKEDIDAITESEILESALSDPDSVVPTEEELENFKKPKDRT